MKEIIKKGIIIIVFIGGISLSEIRAIKNL
jgi:hypothetical protein